MDQIDELRPDTIYRMFSCLQAAASGFRLVFSKDYYHCKTVPFFTQPDQNPRIQTLVDTLQLFPTDQAVIYCRYTQEIHDILSVLGGKAVPFYGKMSVSSRQANKTAFKTGECQYLVANKSCAQFGLNLQFCHREVFYNNDWDWGTRVQAEDRLHRVGQLNKVSIYDIFCKNTLDCTILKCLSRKEDLATMFKREIASHNKATLNQRIRAAAFGQLDWKEEDNGKNIS